MMLILFATPILVACGSDDDEDNSLSFTKEMLVNNCTWDITEVSEKHSGFYVGAYAEFFADGRCKGFFSMENSYRISNGKLYTYYAETNEPMYVYTLLSHQQDRVHEYYLVRVDGTLDDEASFTITIEPSAKIAVSQDPKTGQ